MSKKLGHFSTTFNGINAFDNMRNTLQQEAELFNIDMPTPQQVGLVMSALRMHQIVVHASNYDRRELHHPDKLTEFYPVESSIGRWLRDAGRELMEASND